MKKIYFLVFFCLLFSQDMVNAQNSQVIWSEDFEGDWTQNWYAESGTWEVGIPIAGPDTTYSGQKCAATGLNGNYINYVDSRLVKFTSFTVPLASENPRLRFWHWFNFRDADDDWGKVQVKVNGSVDWIDISGHYNDNSTVWTYASIDLHEYAGQTVQIAFYFHSDNVYEDPGWYIDDVSLLTGPYQFNNPEGWENGIGDWYAESGTWEVGIPKSGPDSAFAGQNCVATNLSGVSNNYVDSRFVSPPVTIPAASENPRLRFWNWFNFQDADDDWGRIQIKVFESSEWIDVSGPYNDNSTHWTFSGVDLRDYAGQTVQIAFYVHTDNVYEGDGWYIDDVSLLTGPYQFNNPEGWENGIGDWYAESGTWEVGIPKSGPDSAFAGQNCVATNLNGVSNNYVDSRFVSPPLTLPSASENPRLRFWHWFDFQDADDDWGKVQVKVNGSADWIDISGHYNDNSTVWTYASIDLQEYAGQTVQFAFYMHTDNVYEDDGWYIDDVSLLTGPYKFNNPEGWENGIGDWYAESGTWEVGMPESGPDSAFAGQNCIATNLNGVSNNYVDSRFVSPPVTLPSASTNPRLRFWHWFDFQDADDDWGRVQIKVFGSTDWINVSEYFNDNSYVWSYMFIDLAPYAGQTIQIAFYVHTDNVYEDDGWYIDDVLLEYNSDLLVNAGDDETINSGSSTTLDATVSGGTSPYVFQWTPEEGLSDPSIQNPVASPAATTTYYLKVTDALGSFKTDEVVVFVETNKSEATDILSYGFGMPDQSTDAIIDASAHTVEIEVVNGTDLTKLIASFVLSEGATATINGVSQESGVSLNDFTTPVTYSITAEDGETVQDWIVTIQIASGIIDNSISKLNIYPNPFSDHATIEFSNPNRLSYKISIFSVAGKKVYEIDNINSDRVKLEKGLLIEGAYILELRGTKSFRSRLFIVE